MSRYFFIIFLLAASGCPLKNSYEGVTTVVAQDGYSLNTQQKCEQSQAAIQVADLAITLVLYELNRDNYIKDYSAATKYAKDHLMVCLIRNPEPCQLGPVAAPPCKLIAGKNRCARKRGCSSMGWAWSSINWPPVCQDDWPDEPHCVKPEFVYVEGWAQNLVHEVMNMAVQRWTQESINGYEHPIYKPGGTEERVQAAFNLVWKDRPIGLTN